MQPPEPGNISIDTLPIPAFSKNKIKAEILRLDKIHPLISGNKWFKLKYYLEKAARMTQPTLVSFGGYWSNHLLATAAACNYYGYASIGIVRGQKPEKLSHNLQQAASLGMQLHFSSRSEFSTYKIPEEIQAAGQLVIPMGGYGLDGARGAAEILSHCTAKNYTHVCCAAGSGTMLAGLILASGQGQTVTGISVMKNNHSLQQQVYALLDTPERKFELFHQFHFGGFGKKTDELIQFMNELYRMTQVPTDFVYTGKLCFAIAKLAETGILEPGSRVLLIHSGGLSGNRSLSKGTLIFE